MAAPLDGRGGDIVAARPPGARPGARRPPRMGSGGRRLCAEPDARPDGRAATSGSSTPPCLLLSGDRPGYAKACAHMIERCGKAGGPRAYHVARACTLAPDAVADASLPGRLAEKELKDSAREFWSLTEQGALAYRAGRFQQAVPFFEQSLQADPKAGPCGAQLAVAGPGQAAPREGRGGAPLAEQGPGVARSVP